MRAENTQPDGGSTEYARDGNKYFTLLRGLFYTLTPNKSLVSNVAEGAVRHHPISPKCEFRTFRKSPHARFQRFGQIVQLFQDCFNKEVAIAPESRTNDHEQQRSDLVRQFHVNEQIIANSSYTSTGFVVRDIRTYNSYYCASPRQPPVSSYSQYVQYEGYSKHQERKDNGQPQMKEYG